MENVEKLLERAEDVYNQAADQDDFSKRNQLIDEGDKYLKHAEALSKLKQESDLKEHELTYREKETKRNFERDKKEMLFNRIFRGVEIGVSVLTIGVTIWSTCRRSNDERRNLEDVIAWENGGSFSSLASRTVAGNSLRCKK